MSTETAAPDAGVAGPILNPQAPLDVLGLRIRPPEMMWDRHGIYNARLLYHNIEKGWFDSDQQVIFRNLQDPKPVKVLSAEYGLFPNEELKERLDKWAEPNGFDYYDDHRYSRLSGDGNAAFYTYLPHGESNGSYFVAPKDAVKVGFLARNSVDGSMGFGLDLFTYRGLCSNGSIVTTQLGQTEGVWNFSTEGLSKNAKEQGATLSHRHTQGIIAFLDKLGDYMDELTNIGAGIITYYKNLAKLQLNQQIADTFANSGLPQKYLPFSLVPARGGKGFKAQMTDAQKRFTLWDTYNAITDPLTHAGKADARSIYAYQGLMHRTFAKVAPLVVQTPRKAA